MKEITGITENNKNVASIDDARYFHAILQSINEKYSKEKFGVFTDYDNAISLVKSGTSVTVQSGMFCIYGRMGKIEDPIVIDIPANTTQELCITYDDSQETNKMYVEIVTGNLTKNDILNGGGKFQYKIADVTSNGSALTITQNTAYADLSMLFSENFASLAEKTDLNSYVKLDGSTAMTGTLEVASSTLLRGKTDADTVRVNEILWSNGKLRYRNEVYKATEASNKYKNQYTLFNEDGIRTASWSFEVNMDSGIPTIYMFNYSTNSWSKVPTYTELQAKVADYVDDYTNNFLKNTGGTQTIKGPLAIQTTSASSIQIQQIDDRQVAQIEWLFANGNRRFLIRHDAVNQFIYITRYSSTTSGQIDGGIVMKPDGIYDYDKSSWVTMNVSSSPMPIFTDEDTEENLSKSQRAVRSSYANNSNVFLVENSIDDMQIGYKVRFKTSDGFMETVEHPKEDKDMKFIETIGEEYIKYQVLEHGIEIIENKFNIEIESIKEY